MPVRLELACRAPFFRGGSVTSRNGVRATWPSAGATVVPPDASSCPALVATLNRPNIGSLTAAKERADAEDGRCRLGSRHECGRGMCIRLGGGVEDESAPGGQEWGVCACEPDVIGHRCWHSLLEVVKARVRRHPGALLHLFPTAAAARTGKLPS